MDTGEEVLGLRIISEVWTMDEFADKWKETGRMDFWLLK